METKHTIPNLTIEILKPQPVVEIDNMEPLYYRVDGTPVFSNEDGQKLRKLAMERRRDTKKPLPVTNPKQMQGETFNRTNRMFAQVDPDIHFINKYRKGKKDEFMLVTDWRAIKEQEQGRSYLSHIPAYHFEVKNGEALLLKHTVVTSKEFIEEFTSSLDNETMRVLKPLTLSPAHLKVARDNLGLKTSTPQIESTILEVDVAE